MKKIFITQITIVIITLFTATLISIHLFSENEQRNIKEEKENSEKWLERMYIENNIYEAIHNDQYSLNIPELQSDSPLLICYYSSMTCKACIDYAKSKIKEHISDTENSERIFFIACNFNEKVQFKETHTIKLNHRGHTLPIDESNSVCFFILWNNTVFHTFIPESKFGSYTDFYLKEIKKKYFK